LLARIEVQQPAQTKKGSIAIVFRFNQALFLVLQLDVRAERVNARAYAFFLQIGGLIIESLSQVHARLGSFDARHSAQRADVLRHHEQDDLLAGGEAVGLAGLDGATRRLVPLPKGKIQDRAAKAGSNRKNLVGTQVPWKWQTRERLTSKLGLKVHAIGRVRQPHVGLRQKFGARDVPVLHAFRGGQDGDLLHGVLLQSEAKRVAWRLRREVRSAALREQSGRDKQ